ncbi:MAG: hypothetical protein JJV98_00415 [Desulfosarcina sp.]|nr:hypothetical protein [Desulfobacterales bacterium]
MHFEILVEDQSGKKTLEILAPKIVGADHTFKVHSYKGIGRIPRNIKDTQNAAKRILLENLPKLLKGYGRTFAAFPEDYPAVGILVCDLDEQCLRAFRQRLFGILDQCNPNPETRFCIAIEEGEAWFLGDLNAIRTAYPRAKKNILNAYVNDSICGTWEVLADAVHQGGSSKLSAKGWQAVGAVKTDWAEAISPHMDISNNASPSFCYFRDKLKELVGVNE